MSPDFVTPTGGDALIVVDIQNDFLPGGALGVHRGDEVIKPLNHAIETFRSHELPIIASRDWHPPNHCSFKERGGPWPVHCVIGTPGAEFSASLRLPAGVPVISKASHRDKEAYSAFDGTGLSQKLKELKVRRLFIGGLATDYCVLNSVRDAVREGLEVVVLKDAIRAVNVNPEDGSKAEAEMRELGAKWVSGL